MTSEPQQPQEPGHHTACPKNPFGHSWKAVAVLEDRVRQRCRFCQQAREVRLPPSQQGREQREMKAP